MGVRLTLSPRVRRPGGTPDVTIPRTFRMAFPVRL